MTRLVQSKLASVAIIAVCQVAAMALWFSASAVVPALVAEYRLSGFAQAALSSGVQAGFVLGCLASAFAGLPIASTRVASVPRARSLPRRPRRGSSSSIPLRRARPCCAWSPARAWRAFIRSG
jgi:hypothetical protein